MTTSSPEQDQLRRLRRMEQYDSASSDDDDDDDDDDDSTSSSDNENDEPTRPIKRVKRDERVSDDDDDDDSSSGSASRNTTERVAPSRKKSHVINDDGDNDGDSSSSSGSSSNSSSGDNSDKDKDSRVHNDSDSNSSNEADDDNANNQSSSSDEDMPLQERLRRKEERGKDMRTVRQQKTQALHEASQRLAKMKKEKKGSSATKNADDNINSSKKKKSKHRPTEVSSKRADFFKRGAPKLNESGIGVEIGAKRYKPVDPRVSNLSGHFNEDQFQKNYAFLEEMRNQEIGQCRKRIAAYQATGDRGRQLRRKLGLDGSDPTALEEEQARLKQLTQERANLERRKIERAAQKSVKARIRADVASGKQGAYFLKRKEKKKLEMEEKLKEVQKRGGKKAVEKMLDRKRRKIKSRDAGIFAK